MAARADARTLSGRPIAADGEPRRPRAVYPSLPEGHRREVGTLAWHPHHAELFASGAQDGTLYYWSTLHPDGPIGQSLGARGNSAHDKEVATIAWHPLGHLLTSGANDNLVKFWARNRPGDGRKREREDADEVFDDEVEMRMQTLANMAQS